MCPIITAAEMTQISEGAGQLPAASPDAAPAAAPSMFRSDAETASAREHWKSSFANIAAQQKIDQRDYAAAEAAHLARFDAETGYKPPSPEVLAEAQRASVHAVNPTASPDQFQIQWPADFVSGAKHLGETTAQLQDFASAMKFTPEVGRSVLERLAVLSSTFRGMTEDQASAWKLNAEQSLKQMFGDQADAKLQAARKALEIAGPEHKLAKLIGQSLQAMDLELVVALTGHGDRWAAFSSKKGKP